MQPSPRCNAVSQPVSVAMMINMKKSTSPVNESPPAYETVIEAIEIDLDLPTYCEAVRCMQEQNKPTEVR